jgi:DHA2 family multidrug resistance protein
MGMAFVFIPLTTITVSQIAKADMGYATSLYSVTRNIGSSAGISFVTTFVARRSQFHQTILAAHLTPNNPGVTRFLAETTNAFSLRGSDVHAAGQQSFAALNSLLVQQATLISFTEAFKVMGVLFILIILPVFLMRRRENV